MKKYKVCVYAICKNEEKFAKKWYESMKEADEIYVLDTGSTDNTVQILKDLGAHVDVKIINPWRFDVARNESLKLVPKDTDIYVCTDLDEIFVPGWRKDLEDSWNDNVVQARYLYNWSLDKYGNPNVSFYYDKIHNKDFEWKYPIHEALTYIGNKEYCDITLKNTVLNHYQDQNKNRSSYLPLLELAVKEFPNDTRCLYLLTREYLIYSSFDLCIKTGLKYLEFADNAFFGEKNAVMRYIGRSYKYLNEYHKAKEWFEKSINVAPNLRDGYVELGMLEFDYYNYGNAIAYFEKALLIKEDCPYAINEIFSWDDTVYRLLSRAYYYTERYKNALEYIDIAIKMNPDNQENIIIRNNIKEKI